jgi:hypothetical protein
MMMDKQDILVRINTYRYLAWLSNGRFDHVIVFPSDKAFGAICPDIDNVDCVRISHTGKATRDINVDQVTNKCSIIASARKP